MAHIHYYRLPREAREELSSIETVAARLLAVAKAAHAACADADEGRRTVSIPAPLYAALCQQLDELDCLPEVPGEAADGWRKAEYLLGGGKPDFMKDKTPAQPRTQLKP